MKNENFLAIAKLGKTVGLQGDLKLHLLCDFPEQFKKGAIFHTEKMGDLEIINFDTNRSLVRFLGYESVELSRKLVNSILLTNIEQTKKNCPLEKDEFFWFDIVGLDVYEDEQKLGCVEEIERIAQQDFLHVKTTQALKDGGFSKQFLIPYVDRYIIKTDIENKIIFVKDALGILENS